MPGKEDIIKTRTDLSPYLFHFTKNDGPQTLKKILTDSKLTSPHGRICFTEMPLYGARNMFEYFKSKSKPMYLPYGIGFPRELLRSKYNALPVLTIQSNSEKNLIDRSLHWRIELLNDTHDFSWLREWRIKGDFDFSDLIDEMVVITDKKNELSDKIYGHEIDPEYTEHAEGSDFRDSFSKPTEIIYRKFYHISVTEASSLNDDNQIKDIVENQKKNPNI